MLDNTNLLKLMKTVASYNTTDVYSFDGQTYSYAVLDQTLRNELNELVGTEDLYEQNKRQLFSLMAQTMNDIVPARLINAYGQFAEIQQYPQGVKPIFVKRTGRQRAKQFITRVGLAGRYEVFQLSSENFEVPTSAIGGAARIGFEEFLDGRVNFAELTEIVMEGMNELIYREISKAMVSIVDGLPDTNKVSGADFDEAAMDYLINTASAYGTPTIYCTREFAVTMIPKEADWISESMRDARWNTGYLANYKGVRVVILPQSFEDETNTTKIIDPSYAWVIPSGENDRPVKVAFEGSTHVREVTDNDDWSRDIQVYRKVGVGVMITNNLFSYQNTTL